MRAGTLIFLVVLGVLALAPAAGASFPGANGKLAVGSECFNGDEYVPSIRAFAPDGSDLGPLTRCRVEGTRGTYGPDWSADGRRLAFWHSDDSNNFHFSTTDADGGNFAELPIAASVLTDAPSFSPDGRRLAYSRHGAIWTAKLDGSNRRRLRKPPKCRACLDYVSPKWSPGGGKIAFESDGDGNRRFRPGLFVVNAKTGKGFKRILRGRGANVDWAPNGRRLVYHSDFNVDFDGSVRGGDLWIIRPNGKGRKRLLRTRKPAATVPAWAPDGKSIAFIRHTFRPSDDGGVKFGSSALMRIGPKGGKARKIRSLKPPSVGEDGFIPPELAWQPLP